MNGRYYHMDPQERRAAEQGAATVGTPVWWRSPTTVAALTLVGASVVFVVGIVGYILVQVTR